MLLEDHRLLGDTEERDRPITCCTGKTGAVIRHGNVYDRCFESRQNDGFVHSIGTPDPDSAIALA